MSTEQRPTHVSVQLTDCARDDAQAVFAALGRAFPLVVEPAGHGAGATDGRPTVWSTTVDVARSGGHVDGGPLTGAVIADLSGGYQAVGKVREALEECFHAEDKGSASGDQEMEIRLRITPRD
ncbi:MULTISPECIES: hypothetical protein [Streptomyces]|uniref:Uncharacterized protein n=2 Tax=Streptomyces TaxID=1883 RepID=A0A3R7J0J6_9ACTN|nr:MULTISPECIES: hypothetical protein [Streptomyces]KNE78943.1 hypothetical protein ADZ36_30380 [Streptomyces fradiae]OFA47526.1 hypothetical protein BEN35_20495 [Streptomyces fradiae]PQM21805.1 hypothetical protein Sfr7A_19415 [Streptomyces xinghaiensis]RKM93237.1 hypothetical protein SFRA_022305 [Streptomyces xinghaiensis]RNC71165.1 hypothetical protein DC095_023085 [Streptomyces xinghaiensis]